MQLLMDQALQVSLCVRRRLVIEQRNRQRPLRRRLICAGVRRYLSAWLGGMAERGAEGFVAAHDLPPPPPPPCRTPWVQLVEEPQPLLNSASGWAIGVGGCGP